MEGLVPRACCGCSASSVQYVFAAEVAVQSGSGLLLLHLQSGQQRVLGSSTWQGIQCFASSVKGGVLAVALKGYQPAVNIFSTHDLQQQASLAAGASLGYTAVAVSHDGELLAVCADSPDLELSVWHWRKGLKLASAKLHAPVSKISFHPADNSVLLTTSAQPAADNALAGNAAACSSSGASTAHAIAGQPAGQAASSSPALLWQLHKLWEWHELQSTPLQLPSACQPTCHAWAPEGVYLGCHDGSLFCISPETGAIISKASPQVIAAAAAGSHGSADNPAQSSDASAGVSSIAVNKQWLVVACSNAPHLSFYHRWSGAQQSDELQPLGSIQVSSVGCSGVAFGGPGHAHLVVSTVDGSLLLLSPGSQFEPGQPDPASLQVEPLADWHVGAITGVAAAATGAHLVSCGLDGSIRVWAAAAEGQLVSKRDVGGRLTCSTACMSPDNSLLAVGSEAGVLRLVNIGDLGSLPVVHHSRLFRAAVTHVGFSTCGTYLAAAAASTGRVALLKVMGAGQQVQLLGYVKAEGAITSLCWVPHAGQQQPQLAVGLASGKLLLLTPPLRPAHINVADLAAANPSSSAEGVAASGALDLTPADVHAVTLSAPTALQAMAALAQDMGNSTYSRSGSTAGANSSAQILAASCDGQLFWLQLPADVGKVPHSRLAGQQAAVVVAKAALPWPAAALAVSPSGREVLVAGEFGAMLRLPTAPGAATAALSGADSSAIIGPCGSLGADATVPAAALAWNADAAWAAAAGSDGSLLVYATGPEGAHGAAAAAALPAPALSMPDCDAADDPQLPTVPEAESARAEHEAWAAAESVRAATMQRLEDLKKRLEQALEANAATPADQQLSEPELVLNSQLLQQQRSSVAAEEAQLLSDAPRKSREQEVQAKRLKALCWDAFQVKRAVCTGLRSADPQVWNFQLHAQDDAEWAQVAEQRREQLLAAHKHILDQDTYARSAASSTAAGAVPAASSTSGASGSADGSSGNRTSDPGIPAANSTASMSTVTDGIGGCSQQATEHLALLTRVKACSDARKCSPADLLLPELGVTSPQNKLMQAMMYQRMIWELKTQFNKDFDELVKQKHTDADRLSDLSTRVDELIRELVKIHLVLNPAATAPPAPSDDADPAAAAAGCSSVAGASAANADNASRPRESGAGGAAEGGADVQSAMQLTAELAAGRLVPFWSPEENLEDMLLKIQPGEVKSAKYLTPAERAKADAEEAAAEAARRAAAADSSRARALQQMMGGRLERSVDEVSELVTSRPAWMVSGDPSTFNEEQLKEYKEYMAKEAAAIEERLKRKVIMETELRTLRAAAEEVASKFDAAVAALAAKRLDVLAEVTALETRVLQLQADEEMATVNAGPEAQAAAAHKLQQVQTALAAVDRELALTQHLHDEQQEALAALHAEEKARDRAFKRDFSLIDPLVLPHLTTMYKNRIIPLDQAGVLAQHSTAAIGHAPGERVGSARRGSVSASPRHARGGQTSASPRASKIGAVGHLGSPRHGAAAAAGQDAASVSAELTFTPLNLPIGSGLNSAAAAVASAQPAAGSGSGAHGRGSSTGIGQQDLCGPLGPPEVAVAQIYDNQMPEGLDEMLWQRFVELHASRAQLDLAVREQTAKVLCLKRQLQLLLQHHAEASEQVEAAAGVLEGLQRQQHRALHDVEVQLKLKQGQVEVWPTGLSSIASEALLVDRGEVKGLNNIILSKGEAKLDMLHKMKEFKRGIHQLEWENKKCEMEAEDVTSLTQQLQLLHVTKEFQQQVKAGASGSSSSSGTGLPGSTPAGTSGRPAGGAAGSGPAPPGSSAAASKEVASLESLLKVRETLHANAVEQKKRQLRPVEAQLAAKRNENATLALHLAGLERLLDEAARLRSSTAADDATSAADRKARSLAMQAKLRDIADAQAAEIAAAERELHAWQQRCFPCLPALPSEDDGQPSGGADQAPSSSRGAGAGSCTLPEIKGATQPGSVYSGAAGELRQSGGGFAPHGARASRGYGGLPASSGSSGGGMFGVHKGGKKYVGPDGKPELLRRG